ncbi:MAG: 2-dehydropantoate 2-reductase [candidate division WOR-3 bacterium]
MKFIVLGVGSVGGYLISKLALAGNTVEAIVSKRSNKRLIEVEGIEYFQKDKRYVIKVPCYVYEDLMEIDTDYFILATKTREALQILGDLKERHFNFNYIVTVQNGIESHFKASQMFGEDHLILSIREGLYAFDLHKIRNVSDGNVENVVTSLTATRESMQKFAELLNSSGIPATVSFGAMTVLYEKLVINSVINPLASILKVKNGYLIKMLHTETVLGLINEALKVLSYEGISLSPSQVLEDLKSVIKATSENKCSMLQDLEKKKKTEIDYINGYLLRLAKKHGIDIPLNQMIYELITRMEELYGAH